MLRSGAIRARRVRYHRLAFGHSGAGGGQLQSERDAWASYWLSAGKTTTNGGGYTYLVASFHITYGVDFRLLPSIRFTIQGYASLSAG